MRPGSRAWKAGKDERNLEQLLSTRNEVAAACRKFGTLLWLPEARRIDGGGCCGRSAATSRHSASTARRGTSRVLHWRRLSGPCIRWVSWHSPAVIKLTELYEHLAHCSFGPWQILLVNCDSRARRMISRRASIAARMKTVKFLNRRALHAQGATDGRGDRHRLEFRHAASSQWAAGWRRALCGGSARVLRSRADAGGSGGRSAAAAQPAVQQ